MPNSVLKASQDLLAASPSLGGPLSAYSPSDPSPSAAGRADGTPSTISGLSVSSGAHGDAVVNPIQALQERIHTGESRAVLGSYSRSEIVA